MAPYMGLHIENIRKGIRLMKKLSDNIIASILLGLGAFGCLLLTNLTAYDASMAMYVLLAFWFLFNLKWLVVLYRTRKSFYGNNEYEVRAAVEKISNKPSSSG